MSFDPQPHLIQLPKRVKNPETGKWETKQEDYLEVKWRLCWFRDRYPHGRIETEEVCVDLDRVVTVEVVTNVDGKRQTQTKTGTGYARFKARVEDGEGGVATGYGTENAAEFADFCERAETRAVGRALAGLGIGTQFVGAELSEGEHIVDSPVTVTTPPASTNGNGDTPAPAPPKGSPKNLVQKADLLQQIQGELTQLGQSVEGATRLYQAAFGDEVSTWDLVCGESLHTLKHGLVYLKTLTPEVSDGATPGSAQVPAAQSTPAPTEVRPASPQRADATEVGPSSASAPAPATGADAERERIVKEAVDAGIAEKEARHIVNHHELKAAERLLLAAAKKRLQQAAA